ncbi:MAG TPA: hypothetical protein VE548_00695 [Nitrososphaeraceae archaeon]|nr:hypothetical protein [Nitrososphaeraceae archaeon]
MTKDAKKCVRAQELGCDGNNSKSPLCTGEKGRGGSILCDEYAHLTGSRIAYGGCYDSKDFCMAVCSNYEAVLYTDEHCDNIIRCADDGSIIRRYCFDKETYCNMPKIDPRDEEYCKSDKFDSCIEEMSGSRCTKGDIG